MNAPVGGGKWTVKALISFTWRIVTQTKIIAEFGQARLRDIWEFRIWRQPNPFSFPDKTSHRNSTEIKIGHC